MKKLIKLSLSSVVHQKLGILVVLLAMFLPFVFAEMTNYGVDAEVLKLARTQVAWQFAWMACLFWLTYQAADLAGRNADSGMGCYFYSRGVGKDGQLTAIWASVMIFGVALCVIPALISVLFAAPVHPDDYKHWVVLSVQHVALMLIVVSCWVMLAVALASRFGVVIGYLGVLAIGLTGWYGVVLLGKVAAAEESMFLDLVYVSLHHSYLADLTHRFVHKQGAMTNLEFMSVLEYLAAWALVFAGVSRFVFNYKQR
ncbi:hypothetical protein SAMN02745181_3616 [Rubritalea squalenifaciens DSM 18772]|uniref:ABC-2 type transport system permease protein n=1 Tax=Rubritalea squalenifaciens DSM 18772 TaxID=1123071 RepID=A0A1M6RJC9_9BACT|nr:hypothetical protein [Rubritalea squalenifaciens]SHK32526.1 hypothetical protein SAMN02745181_3616 [Rubritalea squalenifaciens DSM 18772]